MNFINAINWEERQNSAIASEIVTANVQSLPGKLEFQLPQPPGQCLASVKDRESEFDLIELGGDE